VPDLQHTLEALAAKTDSVPFNDALQQAVDAAATLYPVAGSGVMLADGEHVLHYVAASDGHGRDLERIQELTGSGPCVDALVQGQIVQTTDASADERWPEIHATLRNTAVRAVLGLPIHLGGTVVGSLDVYRSTPEPWPQDEIDGLVAFARLVERLLIAALHAERHVRTIEQLEHALQNRVTIERAVGVLMERERVGPVAAFQRRRTAARNSRRRAADVAREILGEPDS
jgi:GAF domain-containing protein